MNDSWLNDPAQLWPDYRPTRLLDLPELARRCGVRRVLAKAENERPLGNFKVLGGMVAGLRALSRLTGARSLEQLRQACGGRATRPRLICASDGNHGLSVSAAAQRAGAAARVYLPAAVSPARAARIRALGGEVVRVDGSYDDAVLAAHAAAARGDGVLIADTSADPADPVVADVMAGYGLIARELHAQLRERAHERPSHVFVQAGVGGLAAAMAEGLHAHLRAPARIVAVEPRSAACLAHALARAAPVRIDGDLDTCAEMLSCGLASAAALAVLQRHRVSALSVDEAQLSAAPALLRAGGGPDSSASGAAGWAGLLHATADPALRDAHGLDADSSVLLLITEGAMRE
ncbi:MULTISPECIES: pyridoxal-phosphate dependent enzyme [Lysobacter]|uniref:pyridoxal-phosphate dependent enzyme n=2 Tax=Lysobacteraceae TaxID=32033 RepID=UPI001F434EC7|nr:MULTISPECIES: pyridoxal-phosphate dependent enzyme [Lysobacter]UJB19987.1 pyridoxal-phosphate dependent enzyme [Lysobacter capsici]UJQ30898.1 pyridoxal-phosphate dependent enzyme [Lysobacter gummosus]